jgi:hypothetical protein
MILGRAVVLVGECTENNNVCIMSSFYRFPQGSDVGLVDCTFDGPAYTDYMHAFLYGPVYCQYPLI